MAAAFTRAGFTAVDVHMSDLIAGRVALRFFAGFAACGGFSYGDVLGAGRGWATSILERDALRDAFAAFFARDDSFALGVCNGCQMLAQLKAIIPGAAHWPTLPAQPQRAVRGAPGPARSASSRRRCSSAAWPARASRSRSRTAKAAPNSTAPLDQRGRARRAALRRRRRQRRRRATRPTRTARPTASPASTSDDGRATLLMPHPERMLAQRPTELARRASGARIRRGCACSAMRAAGWADDDVAAAPLRTAGRR